MLSKTLKEHLLIRAENSNLKFDDLITCLDESPFSFVASELEGVVGLATHKLAYFDIEKLSDCDDRKVFFVILHEYCHVLKIERMGKDGMIAKLGGDDYDEFVEHIVEEEILADRFGRLMFYGYNKESFPAYRTQQLEDRHNRETYGFGIGSLFGKIKDEETYDKMLESFIINELD